MPFEHIIGVLNYMFGVTMPFTHIGPYVAEGLALFLLYAYWRRLKSEPIFLAIALFIAYGLLRCLFLPDPHAGLAVMAGYTAHWLLPFALGYVLVDAVKVRRAFWTYYITFFVVVFFGVLAYVHLFYDELWPGYVLVERSHSLLKGFRSHIALAALCLVSLYLSAGMAMLEKTLRPKMRYLFIAAAVFFACAIALTGSRGYYIGGVVSAGLFGVAWTLRTGRWKTLISGAAALTVLALALYAAVPGVQARIHRTTPKDDNIQERFALYNVAVREIHDRPVFGFGPGQGIKQLTYFEALPAALRNVSRHPHLHSFYLNMTADLGVVGLLLFFLIISLVAARLWTLQSAAPGFESAVAFGLFWGLVGILIGDSFDTLLLGPGVAMEVFWLAGLVAGAARGKSSAPGIPETQHG